MKYLIKTNDTYASLINEAGDVITKDKQNYDFNEGLCLPVRTILSKEIMPIHEVFNTGTNSLAKTITDCLRLGSVTDAIKEVAKRWPPLLKEGNVDDQIQALRKILLQHSFFLNNPFIQKDSGSTISTKQAYFQTNSKDYYDFDEKTRQIEGYYVIIGRETDVFLVGTPLKNNETIVKHFSESQLETFPLPKHIPSIKKFIKQKQININGISLTTVNPTKMDSKELESYVYD